jgi:hypothetical protein
MSQSRVAGLARLIEKARAVRRESGSSYLLLYGLQRLLSPFLTFGSIRFFARDLRQALPEGSCSVQIQLHRTASAEFALLLPRSSYSPSPTQIRERVDQGDECFVALDAEGNVAHARWVATSGRRRIPELNRDWVLGPGEAYMYDGYTRPDVRCRGVDGCVRRFIFNSLRADGLETVYSYVQGANPVGLRAVVHWQHYVGAAWYLQLRGSTPWVLSHPRWLGRAVVEHLAVSTGPPPSGERV